MRKHFFLAFAICSLFVCCIGAKNGDESAVQQNDVETIRKAVIRTGTAFNERLPDTILSYYSPDILVSFPGIPDTKYKDFSDAFGSLKSQGIKRQTKDSILEIIVDNKLAVVRVNWRTTTFLNDSVSTQRVARDLQVWKKDENSQWKFFRGMWFREPRIDTIKTALTVQPQFIGLFVHNFETMSSWYTQKLGFEIIKRDSVPAAGIQFAMLSKNGFLIEMIQNPKISSKDKIKKKFPADVGTEGFFKLGFYTSDIEGLEKEFKSKGVKFKYPMMTNANFNWKLFIIEDPEGNLIQFYTVTQ